MSERRPPSDPSGGQGDSTRSVHGGERTFRESDAITVPIRIRSLISIVSGPEGATAKSSPKAKKMIARSRPSITLGGRLGTPLITSRTQRRKSRAQPIRSVNATSAIGAANQAAKLKSGMRNQRRPSPSWTCHSQNPRPGFSSPEIAQSRLRAQTGSRKASSVRVPRPTRKGWSRRKRGASRRAVHIIA